MTQEPQPLRTTLPSLDTELKLSDDEFTDFEGGNDDIEYGNKWFSVTDKEMESFNAKQRHMNVYMDEIENIVPKSVKRTNPIASSIHNVTVDEIGNRDSPHSRDICNGVSTKRNKDKVHSISNLTLTLTPTASLTSGFESTGNDGMDIDALEGKGRCSDVCIPDDDNDSVSDNKPSKKGLEDHYSNFNPNPNSNPNLNPNPNPNAVKIKYVITPNSKNKRPRSLMITPSHTPHTLPSKKADLSNDNHPSQNGRQKIVSKIKMPTSVSNNSACFIDDDIAIATNPANPKLNPRRELATILVTTPNPTMKRSRSMMNTPSRIQSTPPSKKADLSNSNTPQMSASKIRAPTCIIKLQQRLIRDSGSRRNSLSKIPPKPDQLQDRISSSSSNNDGGNLAKKLFLYNDDKENAVAATTSSLRYNVHPPPHTSLPATKTTATHVRPTVCKARRPSDLFADEEQFF